MCLGEHFHALLSCTEASQYKDKDYTEQHWSVELTYSVKAEVIRSPSHLTITLRIPF